MKEIGPLIFCCRRSLHEALVQTLASPAHKLTVVAADSNHSAHFLFVKDSIVQAVKQMSKKASEQVERNGCNVNWHRYSYGWVANDYGRPCNNTEKGGLFQKETNELTVVALLLTCLPLSGFDDSMHAGQFGMHGHTLSTVRCTLRHIGH
jgi:hypothetical protein